MTLVDEQKDIKSIFTEKIAKHLYKYYWQELGLGDWESKIQDKISEVSRNKEILKTVESFIGSLRDKRVLIVGSGWGGACVAAKHLRAEEVIGIDIDDEVNEIGNLRMQLEGYKECCLYGAAEHIPFADSYFDYVHCFTVLEHVSDVRKSLSEIIRVVKRGGHVFIQAPSYVRPIEKHYKIPYIPLMPKKLAKMYLRLLKRPPNFIDSINYIWPHRIKKMLSHIKNIEVYDIADEYKNRFASVNAHADFNHLLAKSTIVSEKRNIARILLRKILSETLTIFYKTWDFVFGTQEIYFLIHKYEETVNVFDRKSGTDTNAR